MKIDKIIKNKKIFNCVQISIIDFQDFSFILVNKTIFMAFLFENLDVYKKSVDFADKICKLTESFPKRELLFSRSVK